MSSFDAANMKIEPAGVDVTWFWPTDVRLPCAALQIYVRGSRKHPFDSRRVATVRPRRAR